VYRPARAEKSCASDRLERARRGKEAADRRTGVRRFVVVASALALGMQAMPVQAQTIASKIELLGAPASLEFTGLRMREQNGLLNVQAELTNRDNRQHTAYYRVKWMDETGFQVWDDEPWKPLLPSSRPARIAGWPRLMSKSRWAA